MFDRELFDDARREFLSHLLYAKGHSKTTCYVYNSDLGIWRDWLIEAGKDWQAAQYRDVEQFAAWLMRTRGVKAHIVNRRLSALSTFYKWLQRGGIVDHDPVALAVALIRLTIATVLSQPRHGARRARVVIKLGHDRHAVAHFDLQFIHHLLLLQRAGRGICPVGGGPVDAA